ncbi:MAG: chorismate-binding protein [Gammaproteobacteria bacterium]|nr:chorismate-binding protein [Gammaproteobacteria bacterium]MBU1414257.1 chorismate-binding protein [Gammaproteobacteria bacterium]
MRNMEKAYCEIDLPVLGDEDGNALAFSGPVEMLHASRAEEVNGVLTRAEQLAATGHWLVGFVAYEAASAFDAALVAHERADALPLAAFAVFDSTTVPRQRAECMWGNWRDSTAAETFDTTVAAIEADIADGRFYQVNYTTRLRAPLLGDAAALFDALRVSQPGAYSAYLEFGRWRVCSVSPELFFHWRPAKGGAGGVSPRLTLRPMKGTAPRDADPECDRINAKRLSVSEKDRAENLMIVDLLRNDASRVAELGSVAVTSLFDTEPWETVWQMTSTVECRTRPDVRLADLFGALFPCGSVTGAPKAEAMRAIRELEPAPRGVYCGAIGVVMPGGEARFNVGIRTVVVDAERHLAECGIGSGIVADSSIAGEREEWRVKERFLRQACPDYELLETLLWRRGRFWLLAEHLARLERSAVALGFDFAREAILAKLEEAARGFDGGRWRMRLRLAMDGAVAIDAEPIIRKRGEVFCGLAKRPVDSANPWLRHKTTRRGIYDALAIPDLFDTLLFNERGEATEFTRGNLVVRRGGRLLTPALDCGLLPGAFRAALLARGSIREAAMSVAEVESADAIWFVNSVRGALPVRLASDLEFGPLQRDDKDG